MRNTGEFGTDTFDLTVSSAWPTTLYQADGSTPLADTDGDGTPDTGPIAQGDSMTIVVKIALPAGAAAGNSNTAQVSATPSNSSPIVKTARFQTAIPASFAQTYVLQASWMGPSRAIVGFYRPYQQVTCQTPDQSAWGSVVATAPNGKIVQVWRQSRTNGNGQSVWELYHAVLGGHGNVIRPAARITDLEGAITTGYELDAAVAVAPDGRIGITWRRRLWNSDNGSENNNIYFLMLDGNGATVVAPTNLTNNGGWGTSNTPNVPKFNMPNHRVNSRRPLRTGMDAPALRWQLDLNYDVVHRPRRRWRPGQGPYAVLGQHPRRIAEFDLPGRRHAVPGHGPVDGQPIELWTDR